MRAVIQRVKNAWITVNGGEKQEMGAGLVVLFGVREGDDPADTLAVANKISQLRIFEDADGKMNRGLEEVNGELMIISQFTLYGNCKKGRRPDFLAAARPEVAIPLYEKFVAECRAKGFRTETGEFGAYMEVDSLNDGPLTLVVDTDNL